MKVLFKGYGFDYETQNTMMHYFMSKYSSTDYKNLSCEALVNCLLDLVDKFNPPEKQHPRLLDVPELITDYMGICFSLEAKEYGIDNPDDLLPILENNINKYLEN